MTMTIDQDSPGYKLGQLFALYEHIQKMAQPKINNPMGDILFEAAKESPVDTFGYLLDQVKRAYIPKLKSRKYWETLLDNLMVAPQKLSIVEKGLFGVGYSWQRREFHKFQENT